MFRKTLATILLGLSLAGCATSQLNQRQIHYPTPMGYTTLGKYAHLMSGKLEQSLLPEERDFRIPASLESLRMINALADFEYGNCRVICNRADFNQVFAMTCGKYPIERAHLFAEVAQAADRNGNNAAESSELESAMLGHKLRGQQVCKSYFGNNPASDYTVLPFPPNSN